MSDIYSLSEGQLCQTMFTLTYNLQGSEIRISISCFGNYLQHCLKKVPNQDFLLDFVMKTPTFYKKGKKDIVFYYLFTLCAVGLKQDEFILL